MFPRDGGWRKSSFCVETPNCVLVRIGKKYVSLRGSRYDVGSVLRFDYDEWAPFLLGVRNDEFALPL